MAPVLVVDDDTEIRLAVRTLLEGEGYRVFEAASGTQALEFMRASHECCVVVFDNLMPDGDGTDILAAVASGDGVDRHAFICMAASPNLFSQRLRELLAELGVPCILKPFELDELLAAVDDANRQLGAHAEGAAGGDETSRL